MIVLEARVVKRAAGREIGQDRRCGPLVRRIVNAKRMACRLAPMPGYGVSGLILAALPFPAAADQVPPVGIPLQHVASDDDETDFDALGIMIGVNGARPRLYQFDTGSDMFLGQFEETTPGVQPVPGSKPGLYGYGDGTYGYWMQEIQFATMAYYHPDDPGDPIVTIPGKHIAGRIIDWVYNKKHDSFKDLHTSDKPVGNRDGVAYYADLEVRERMKKGEPSDHPPFYGTFGAGDYSQDKTYMASPGTQTKSGYVVSANANMGSSSTPGCAPCLSLHLTPQVRAQFTAVMPWGKLDYDDSLRQFPSSGANASNMHDGNYSYTISVPVGKKKRAVDFRGPILFDTGTAEFILVDADGTLSKFRSKGYKLAEYDQDSVDIKFYGFGDKLNDLEYDDIIIGRLADEDSGNTVTIGLPFFQSNSVMYDLEKKVTAYSPYFVTTGDFSTDTTANIPPLREVNEDIGSSGWVGLAGTLSGKGDFTIKKDANVRMTGANTYTGATHIADGGYLHLAGHGSIEHSARILNEGTFYIDHKGSYLTSWGVDKSFEDAVIRDISGSGDIVLGANRLIVTAATGSIGGSITDYDDNNKNLGGGLVLIGGKLTIAGNNDYSGLTEVASGAEMHVTGQLTADVSVYGKLIVDGQVFGTVKVNNGGTLSGTGTVGSVNLLPGGMAGHMKTTEVD
ncbi:hypothetical protein BG36_01930 [Aquamicrobium defluvii]|uniref:Autotransporter-associated beta strand protein n=1 Tax=Aquamicrobium defluvii TaxID=69279 RepID=A0A011VQJ5_9HYPH|nr:hypothetical protein BG36_01930 [Aquamicrobium defluvii]EZQ17839.1 hypothetical protein CF98_33555 [Halopseudomonas bauzanensis]